MPLKSLSPPALMQVFTHQPFYKMPSREMCSSVAGLSDTDCEKAIAKMKSETVKV